MGPNSRSSSDPNLKSHLMDMEDIHGGYTSDGGDQGCADSNQDDFHVRSSSAIPSGLFDEHASQVLESRVADSLPPEKVERMTSYLVSLPVVLNEEEMDQGINVPSPSDSGSPYSSPFLTPPDEEHIQELLKVYQETNRVKMAAELTEAKEEGKMEVESATVRSSSSVTSQSSTGQVPVDRQPIALAERTPLPPDTHSCLAKTASLPTPLRSRNTAEMLAPRSPLFPPLEDKHVIMADNCSLLTTDTTEDAGMVICSGTAKTVQDRIKEIEGLNTQLHVATLERPDSDGSSPRVSTSSKRMSGGSLTNASSDESLSLPRFSQLAPPDNAAVSEKSLPVFNGAANSVDEISCNSKSPVELLHRSTSPLLPVEQEPSSTQPATENPSEDIPSSMANSPTSIPPEASVRRWSPSMDQSISSPVPEQPVRGKSTSPFPPATTTSNISPSNLTEPSQPLRLPNKTLSEQGKVVSQMTESLTTPNSPGTLYRNASRAAAQLAQQRGLQSPQESEKDLSASADEIWDSSTIKGVRELTSIFGGGSLGRSRSMRERERPMLPTFQRKVSGSISPCFDAEGDDD